ncbi:MAG TPA: hypothetical protein VIK38_14185 [Coriobacteriia bacterium]
MASIDVGIHPDAARILARRFADKVTGTLGLVTDAGIVDIYVDNRPVLDALQAALDEIRAEMGRAEQAAMAAKRTARAEEIRAGSVPDTMNCAECGSWAHRTAAHAAAQTASDQVPTVDMAPGELVEVYGK